MTSVLQLVLSVPPGEAELASDRLWGAGARAIEERVISERVELRTVLSTDQTTARRLLGDVPGEWSVSFEQVDAAPSEDWRAHVQPIRVNERCVIVPAWLDVAPQPDETYVRIEPGAAFGLGDHPTTRLAAEAVWEACTPGARVLDVGCGTGVLSIIAAHREACEVVGVDTSAAAIEVAQANVEMALRDRVISGDVVRFTRSPVAELGHRFNLVVANILAPVLCELADEIVNACAPGATIVLSGILADRYDHVLAAYEPCELLSAETLQGWARLTLRA